MKKITKILKQSTWLGEFSGNTELCNNFDICPMYKRNTKETLAVVIVVDVFTTENLNDFH